jgi:hypothetical protein
MRCRRAAESPLQSNAIRGIESDRLATTRGGVNPLQNRVGDATLRSA